MSDACKCARKAMEAKLMAEGLDHLVEAGVEQKHIDEIVEGLRWELSSMNDACGLGENSVLLSDYPVQDFARLAQHIDRSLLFCMQRGS